jgi:DNA processing protein
MYNEEDIAILRLYRSNNLGSIGVRYLIEKYSKATEVIRVLKEDNFKWHHGQVKIASEESVLKEIDILEAKKTHLITLNSLYFPDNAKFILDFPPILIALGNKDLLKRNNLAVVGSREASLNGLKFCKKIVGELKSSFIITSGLANGIDHVAHEASLSTGTIGVCPGGVDVIYPFSSKDLYDQILQKNSLLISHKPCGTNPNLYSFPARNAIIAGICDATLLIESRANSGALLTANKTLKNSKKVFVVPGHPFDEKYAGNNSLLKNSKCIICLNAQDILEEFQIFQEKKNSKYNIKFDSFTAKEKNKILSLLSFTPVYINDLVNYTHIDINKTLSILIELKISGIAEIAYDNKVYLI